MTVANQEYLEAVKIAGSSLSSLLSVPPARSRFVSFSHLSLSKKQNADLLRSLQSVEALLAEINSTIRALLDSKDEGGGAGGMIVDGDEPVLPSWGAPGQSVIEVGSSGVGGNG